jgi:beta-glucosidase
MKLTREEQIRLVTGKGSWHTNPLGGKLPSIHLSDGPHGLRAQEEGVHANNNSALSTCYPTESALACSWDTAAVSEVADALASEAAAAGVSVVLGPGVNMKRSPLCGRNFEYFSEDPFLAGTLAAAYIRAMQARGVGTSLKHFAGNSQETHRQTSNSQIDERALRSIYLAAFKRAVQEGKPATIMASYNRLGGVYACENKWLLSDVLRGEWGYQGTVISDWSACIHLDRCIAAGMDLEMPDSRGVHGRMLQSALAEGRVPQEALDRAADNVQKLIADYAGKAASKPPVDPHEVAYRAEVSSAVLLKNDGGALPLRAGAKLAVIGALAVQMRFQGGGSSHIHTRPYPDALTSLKESGFSVTYAAGYRADTDDAQPELEREALRACEGAETVLFFGGLTERIEGEGFDRKSYEMPQNQLHLLDLLLEAHRNVVFVAFGGAPFSMPFADRVRAILHLYLGGEAVGRACAALLSGTENPSGKLAETYPLCIEDTPCYGLFGLESDDVEYRESLFVGYRYYDTFHIPVRFPFGHGLSYTTFRYDDLRLERAQYAGGALTVSFCLTNTGDVAGREISQLYIRNPAGRILRADRELRGFAKTLLAPGESRTVTLTLDEEAFSWYDTEKGRFVLPSGSYEVQIGASLADIRLRGTVSVSGTDDLPDDQARFPAYFRRDGSRLCVSPEEFERLLGAPLSAFDGQAPGDYTTCNSLRQLAPHSHLARMLLRVGALAVRVLLHGKDSDDPEAMMLLEGIRNGTADCVSMQSGGLVPYRVIKAMVQQANGHPMQAVGTLLTGGKRT